MREALKGIWVVPLLASILILSYSATSFTSASALSVFFSDLNADVPPEFSGITTTEPRQGFDGIGTGTNTFTGDFLRNTSGDAPTNPVPVAPTILTLTDLPPHTSIDINFLLAIIDSWDGTATSCSEENGPDIFNVKVDGNVIFSHTFQNAPCGAQSYVPPPGVELVRLVQLGFSSTGCCPDETTESAYNMGLDPTFQNIPHTSSTLTIEWFTNDQFSGITDESWAIDNVEIVLEGQTTGSLTGLGALLDDDFFSFGIGVSDDGSVVAVNSFSENGLEGAKWTAADGLVAIGDLPGGDFESFPTAVSADGSVIVGGSASGNSFSEAFMWTETGGIVGLGDLPGGIFSSGAHGVSADGSVIVGGADGFQEAFMWTATDGMVGLGAGLEDGNSFVSANDVTDDGSLIVGFGFSSGQGSAYTWTATDGAVAIDDPLFSEAIAVSSDGSVMVGYGFLFPSTQIAVKWTEAEGAVSLGTLPGDLNSFAFAVSPDGSIIVGSSGSTAFIWDEENGMRNLKQVLENNFVDLTGWDLTAALGVTTGQSITVVGEGTNPAGDFEGWIAVIESGTSDTIPPVITLNGVTPVTLEVGIDTYTELGATVSDNDPAYSETVTVGGDTVDANTIGTYIVTYNAPSDAAGNTPAQVTRTVNVDDMTLPVITLNGDATVTILEGETYVEDGATITDNSGEDLSSSLVIDSSAVDTSTAGTYQVTYDVSDSAGNAAQVTRTVQVITATQATQQIVDESQNIIDNNPGTPLANTVQGAQASAQTAITELNKTPPDNQAAAGNVEGAVGTLEDAIKDDGLDPVQGEQLINQLLDVSRQIAVNAINTANNTPGSDAGKISSANAALANGDSLRTPPTSFGDFKDAAA